MNEDLYKPLPDLNAYLKRMDIPCAKDPTLEFLNELVYAHQCHIPFEDLDIFEKGAEPSLGVADLFDKVVTRKRGGYCFELNGLFHALLKELGFDVQASMARVLLRPIPHPAISHRANIVTLDETRYLVDVGFGGPMPGFALALEDGQTQTGCNQTFTPYKHDEHWWNIEFTNSAGESSMALRICTMPSEEHDFVPLSFYQSQNPQSVFRNSRRVNVRTADGAHDIRDSTYTRFQNGQKTVIELATDAEVDAILAEHFGIVDWR